MNTVNPTIASKMRANTLHNIFANCLRCDGDVAIVFCLTVKRTPSGTRFMRYFIIDPRTPSAPMYDITGLVASAIGKQWNNKTGTLRCNGGDGTDAIDALGMALYGNTKRIRTQSF